MDPIIEIGLYVVVMMAGVVLALVGALAICTSGDGDGTWRAWAPGMAMYVLGLALIVGDLAVASS